MLLNSNQQHPRKRKMERRLSNKGKDRFLRGGLAIVVLVGPVLQAENLMTCRTLERKEICGDE